MPFLTFIMQNTFTDMGHAEQHYKEHLCLQRSCRTPLLTLVRQNTSRTSSHGEHLPQKNKEYIHEPLAVSNSAQNLIEHSKNAGRVVGPGEHPGRTPSHSDAHSNHPELISFWIQVSHVLFFFIFSVVGHFLIFKPANSSCSLG